MVEDTADSSMAGQFESVIDIRGLDAFTVAVKRVLVSRERAGASDQPIAVLVQPLLEPTSGGVMFGIDPVTGRGDRRVDLRGARCARAARQRRGPRVAVPAPTERQGDRVRRERRSAVDPHRSPALDRHSATRSPRSSGDHRTSSGRSPRTASCGCSSRDRSPPSSRGTPVGPIFGPGPVAETFPEPLTELERDLWVPPLREALREAVVLAGAATRARGRRERRGDHGRRPRRHRPRGSPVRSRPSTAFSRSSIRFWRHTTCGRRGASAGSAPRLPRLAENLLDSVDADLEAVPALDRAHELPAHRADAPEPGDPALAARPRDHDGDAHRDRPQPDDRRVGGAARAGRSTAGRFERHRHPRPQPDRARAHAAACRTGARAPRSVFGASARQRRGQRQRQRHPARGAPTPRALGAGALRARRVGARCTAHRAPTSSRSRS